MMRVNQFGIPDPQGAVFAADMPENLTDPVWNGAQWRSDAEVYRAFLLPEKVSQRQARLALHAAGHLAEVDATLEAIADADARERAKIEWQFGTEIRRDSELVTHLAPALGLSMDQVDELFVQASQL